MQSNTNSYVKDFKSLLVWQKSIEVAKYVYIIAKRLPAFELKPLKSQILASAYSISANIAEGNSQLYKKKEITFFSTAIGSAAETRNWLVISLQNEYISQEEFKLLDDKLLEIIKMLHTCIKRLKEEAKGEEIV